MSAAPKFTPGPWKATYRGAGGWAIHNAAWCEYLRDARTTKADARLIAASPELYEALQWIAGACEQVSALPTCGERDFLLGIVTRARAALAKVDA